MNYTLITMWTTTDKKYHSATADKVGYDSAVGEFHSKFKPMQNDANVLKFTLFLIDEFGNKIEKTSWTRPTEEPISAE